jgi:hypothetical protein
MKKLFIGLLLLVSGSALAQTSEVTFWVDGVCGMCEKRIESALINSSGVKFADWDHEILSGAGHDTQKVRAKDEDYAKVPGCCKYRTLEKH